jgi:hypothetical protein
MMQARAAGGHAMGAARNLRGAARHAAYAAGQAGAVAHAAAQAAVALEALRGDSPIPRHRLEPSPSTTVDVFSCDLPPVLTVDPGDTVVLRS